MENVCRLELEMNYDLLASSKDYKASQIQLLITQIMGKFLYRNSDGLWYSRDKYDHERIYGTLLKLIDQPWFRKYVKVCKVYKEEDNDIEDIKEQIDDGSI